jgi:hypothetical protein
MEPPPSVRYPDWVRLAYGFLMPLVTLLGFAVGSQLNGNCGGGGRLSWWMVPLGLVQSFWWWIGPCALGAFIAWVATLYLRRSLVWTVSGGVVMVVLFAVSAILQARGLCEFGL